MKGFDSIIPACSVTGMLGVELGLNRDFNFISSVTIPNSIQTFSVMSIFC